MKKNNFIRTNNWVLNDNLVYYFKMSSLLTRLFLNKTCQANLLVIEFRDNLCSILIIMYNKLHRLSSFKYWYVL